jgi:hypothetical protein
MKALGDPEAPPQTPEAEALRIAATWAAEQKKRWTLPAKATLNTGRGRRLWLIQSNATGKGYSLAITIDDVTGQVVAHHEYPR